MKAILIVDIPEEYENREPYFVEGTLFYHIDNPYTPYCYAFNIEKTELRPIPQKKYVDEELAKYCEEYDREIGWNDCIDEILGGK